MGALNPPRSARKPRQKTRSYLSNSAEMSHFTTVRTKIVSTEALLQALAEMGYRKVDVHEDPQPLHGFQGDERSQRAHVIIRRKQIGRLSNDIGFERQGDGSYRAWISEWDRQRYDERWIEDLHRRYARHATQEALTAQGFKVADEVTDDDGTIRLVLRRAI
jgi:hypothetical protein